jgi:hypothetical protein
MSRSKDPVSIEDRDFERLKLEVYNKMNNEELYNKYQNIMKQQAKREVVILQEFFNKNELSEPSVDESILINELIDISKKKDK